MAFDFVSLAAVAGAGFVVVATAAPYFFDHFKRRKNEYTVHSKKLQTVQAEPKATSAVEAVVTVAKWFTCPTLTIAAAWSFAENVAPVLAAVPAIFSQYSRTAADLLPIYPKSLLEAFELGEISQLIRSNPAALSGALADKLAKLVGRPVTAEELARLPQVIRDLEANRGIISRVASTLSIVNVIWFVSILGLTALAAPTLWVLAKPLRNLLWKVWKNIIVPTFLKLRPVYEPILYAAALFCMVESARYPTNDPLNSTGVMIGATSIALFGLSWAYTTYRNSTKSGDFEMFMAISSALVAAYSAPLAICHRSSFLGYISVASLVSSLGFSVFSSNLCLFLGFGSAGELARCTAACFLLNIINACAKAVGTRPEAMAPFSSAINSVGTSVFFIGLTILTADARTMLRASIVELTAIAGHIVMGEFLGMPGMTNVAKTFLGLYLLTLYCSHPPRSGEVLIVWLFALFAGLFTGSLYVNRHPELITALYAGVV